MGKIDVWLIDVGVLFDKDHPDYDGYNVVYDKKYGYYDEIQRYSMDWEKAIEFVRDYVAHGVEDTYGIVSKTWLPEEALEDTDISDVIVEDEDYMTENVIFSVRKRAGNLEEDFVERQGK